ncbi:MAG: tetratricopeptide repeat protein [Myxococcota bacterium]
MKWEGPHLGRPHLGRPHLGRPHLGRPHLGRPHLGRPHLGRVWAAVAILTFGCPPTLSRPESGPHLDYLAQGEREMRHGRFDAAATAFSQAASEAERRVDRDEARYRQSRALREGERFHEAIAILDEIAATRPPSRRTARAIFDAALLHERLGDESEAIAGFERVVRQHSDEGPAARALRLWLSKLPPGSARRLTEVLHRDLRDTDLADDLLAARAELALEEGDRQGARGALEQLVADHPYPQGHRWDDAIERLAQMDLEDGAPEQAVRRLSAMLERAEQTTIVGSYTLPAFPRAQLEIARIYRDHLADPEAAEDAFEELSRRFPDSTLRDDATVELGEMLLGSGRIRRGCEMLRDAVAEFDVGSARRRATARIASDCD